MVSQQLPIQLLPQIKSFFKPLAEVAEPISQIQTNTPLRQVVATRVVLEVEVEAQAVLARLPHYLAGLDSRLSYLAATQLSKVRLKAIH